MLKKEDIKDGILLVFDPKKEFKENLTRTFLALIFINGIFRFLTYNKLKTYTFIYLSLLFFLILLLYSYFSYLKTFFLFSQDQIVITQKSYFSKKILAIKYYEIKQLSTSYRTGKGYSYYIQMIMTSGQEYDFLKYTDLKKELDEIIKTYEEAKKRVPFYEKLKKWEEIYFEKEVVRYEVVMKKMLEEEKVFLIRTEDSFIVNSGKEAIYHLEIFKGMEFQEMDFYKFYLDYLSNKNYENTLVRVADNGRDYKELSMKQLKEDINKLRDET